MTERTMGILTSLGSRVRRSIEPTALDLTTPYSGGVLARPLPRQVMPPPAPAAPRPTPGQLTARRHRVRLVVEDVDTGERVVLAETTSWRSIEVLGSAARYYAAHYDNPERPREQVRARRAQASKLGAAIWETAEATVGIELP